LMMREFFMQIFFKHHLFALVLKLGTIMSQWLDSLVSKLTKNHPIMP
jgi:hypothetical protein